MIKSLYIDNFKALNNFRIEMNPLTVLIGANGSGKTSVLQALDLIANFTKMDIDAYLDKRNWAAYDLKSKTNNNKHMVFRILFGLDVSSNEEEIEWEFTLNPVKTKEKILVINERITNKKTQQILLSVTSQGISRFNFQENKEEIIPPLNMTSSFLKNIDISRDKLKFPALVALKEFFAASDSFELLSTEKMRKSSRGDADTIGMGGEKLAAFIHGLGIDQKKNVSNRLQSYVPFIDDVDTEVKGRPGWIEIKVAENFRPEARTVTINPAHVSDGILRMLAISALIEIDKASGIILLDEIEDGINPYLAGPVVNDLKEMSESKQRQIVVTTHNSVMLDYFPEESIVFMWRDRDGVVNGHPMFSTQAMRDELEYMYPGEVWINMNEKEIVEKMLGEKQR
ncbi:MAG: AAA family ATPase [Syntrophomonas sp.]